MSVHDETHDRPICDYCKQIIPYGEKLYHYHGTCIDQRATSVAIDAYDKADYKIPMIEISPTSVLENCDLCGDIYDISQLTWTGLQMLCKKCMSV